MDQNKKILKLGLVITAVILLLSIGFSLFIKIKDPVFLKTYSERRTNIYEDNSYFETLDYHLYYITNVEDNRRITNIIFDDAPDLDIQANDRFYFQDIFSIQPHNQNYNDKIIGRYKLKESYLVVDLNNLNREFESLELSKAQIYFDNGDILDVDLGEFIIYNEKNSEEYVESGGGGSSSNNERTESEITKYIKKDIGLINLDLSLLEKLEGLENVLEINFRKNHKDKIDYRNLEGTKLEEGDTLTIHSYLSKPDDVELKYIFYDVSPRLYYKDEEDNIFNTTIHHVVSNYRIPDFSFMDILKYLRSRGEI